MVCSYVVIIDGNTTQLKSSFYMELFLHSMGWLQLAVSIVMYAFYLTSRAPLEIMNLSKDLENSHVDEGKIEKVLKFIWTQAGNCY